MSKIELVKIYKILDKCLSDFQIAYQESKNGPNAIIRKEGTRKLENSIRLAKYWIHNNDIVYQIASGGGGDFSDFHRSMFIEETFSSSFFANDIQYIM